MLFIWYNYSVACYQPPAIIHQSPRQILVFLLEWSYHGEPFDRRALWRQVCSVRTSLNKSLDCIDLHKGCRLLWLSTSHAISCRNHIDQLERSVDFIWLDRMHRRTRWLKLGYKIVARFKGRVCGGDAVDTVDSTVDYRVRCTLSIQHQRNVISSSWTVVVCSLSVDVKSTDWSTN